MHTASSPVLENIYLQHLWISDESKILGENEVAFIAKKDDVLMIDNETGLITLNGMNFYENLNPSSKFIRFEGSM